MESSAQDYTALAAILQPNQAIAVTNERLRAINKLNSDVADWIMERRRLEEVYTSGLRKLARRTQPDDGASLGVFELPWQRILAATESLAQSHETLASEIEMDVERPLREYANKNDEMKFMVSAQNDLTALAKTLEATQKKAEKLKGSKASGKSTKNAVSAAEEAKSQWNSRVPPVFEKLQSVDEHRINHLRDVLTQYQTHEADNVERNRRTAESSLNALLNIEVGEEIRTFAMQKSGGRTVEMAAQSSPPAAIPQPDVSEPLSPPPRIHDDAASQLSGRSNQGRSSFQAPEPRHSTFGGGLKRLGTVMVGRRKSVIAQGGSSSPPEKKFRSPFTSFRRTESSRSFHQMDHQPSSTNGLNPVTAGEPQSQLRPPSSSNSRTQDNRSPVTPPVTAPNGTTIQEIPEITEITESNEAVAKKETSTETSPKDLPQPPVDSDGYSERPSTIDEITKAQREATSATEETGINLTIRDQAIPEDESEAQNALSEMASTLRRQAQQSGISRNLGTLRGRRDVRNTIFVPNPAAPEEGNNFGLQPAVGPAVTPVSAALEQPVKGPASLGSHPEEQTLSDSTSIHSSHTLHSLSGPISHPELGTVGLNASIVEKLNVLVSDGKVTRSFVVGELALAYNPPEKSNSNSQLVRLDNFQILERVAANPQFVIEKPPATPSEGKPAADEDGKGQYNIQLASIVGHNPTVAFKYQIHLDSSNLSSYCPVIFTPIWNEEEFQASVIIEYSLNPQFNSAAPLTTVILKNLNLSVNLDLSPIDESTKQPREVARATGAVMHPNTGAIFRRKTSSVTWKIPELEVIAGQSGKFLARFTTTTSWPRKGKVDAKFDATGADNNLRLGISASVPAAVEGESKEKENDPFADESANAAAEPKAAATSSWEELHTQRRLAVARYIAH